MKKLSSSYWILVIVLGSITITTVLADTYTITTYPYTIQDQSNNPRLVITSSGNVGIDTVNPAAKLELPGNSVDALMGDPGCGAGFVGIGFGGLSGCTNYAIIGNNAGTYINRPSGGLIAFRENNIDQMNIVTGGNVGIGTTNPAQKLEVAGNAQFDQQTILGRQNVVSLQSYSTGTDNAIFNFYQAQNFPASNNFYRSLDIVSGSANTPSIIRFLTIPADGSGPTPTEVVRIDQNGNVGIGTTAPAQKLDVSGNIRLTGNIVSPNDICIGTC